MTLGKWLEKTKMTSDAFASLCGVSAQTVKAVARGMKLNRYDVASAISRATEGKVTVKELCE